MWGASIRRRIGAGLLVPLLLIGSSAFGYSRYRCRFDSVARETCCCPAPDEDAPENATLGRACCCDVERLEVARTSSAREAGAAQLPVIAVAAAYAPLAALRFTQLAFASPTRRGVGPPLRFLKHSFLL